MPVDEEEGKDENAVNLMDLFRRLWHQRRLIAKITGAFVLLGLIVALVSPVEYTSRALLMPEMKSSSESSAGELLQSYGGMLGLGDFGSMKLSKEGKIAPEVYPKIVKSLTFQDQLLQQDIYFSGRDTTVSGYTYFEKIRDLPLFEFLVEYSIKLPEKFSSPEPKEQLPAWLQKQFSEDKVIRLTKDKLEIIQDMRERITIELSSETGVLTITSKMPDPIAAAQVNRSVIGMLKEFIKAYSTQKAKEDLAFAKEQHRQAQKRLKEVQNNLTTFLDQNLNIATAKSRAKEQRLQAEFDLAYNMYNNVSRQLMEARMKVQEQTPVFKPLQPVNVPLQKSEPQRLLILVLSLLVGLAVSFIYVAGRDAYQKVSERM